MEPAAVEALAPVFGMMVIAFVVSIPLVAWGVRYAARPLVDAMAKYREVQAGSQLSEQAMLLHDRRLSLLEAELQHMQGSLQQLVEAEEFRRQLERPAAAPALPEVAPGSRTDS